MSKSQLAKEDWGPFIEGIQMRHEKKNRTEQQKWELCKHEALP